MTFGTRRRLAATLAGALTATLAAAGSVAVTTAAGAGPAVAATSPGVGAGYWHTSETRSSTRTATLPHRRLELVRLRDAR
jgi:hypothetical protein